MSNGLKDAFDGLCSRTRLDRVPEAGIGDVDRTSSRTGRGEERAL
jgi:hypothetical protein